MCVCDLRSTREIPRVLFSDATGARKKVRTIRAWKGIVAYIYVRAEEARNGLEDKERDVDGGWRKTCVMMIGRGSSSHWTNLMELKAFDRRVYST